MAEEVIIDISDLVTGWLYETWLAPQSHKILKGGRSSTKSSSISLELVCDFIEDEKGNVVCLRKVGKYLSTSVYEQIKWAIYTLQVEEEFDFMKSPLKIVHRETQTAFYFYGVDDPQKLKSAKIAKGYVMALWFEELAEFAGVEDIDIVEDTFIRENIGGKDVRVYFSYNPPRNPYSWINEWVEEKANDPDYYIHHSTYLDDDKGFLSPQMLRKIEKYKENDPDYHRWMYLGEVIGMGTNIYNMNLFQPLNELPADDPLVGIYFSTDSGHQVSATVHLAVGLTRKLNVILLDTSYYSPDGKRIKKAPSELSVERHQFVERVRKKHPRIPVYQETIDSAEGALRNQYYKDFHVRLHPVAKGKKVDMIDYVLDLLAQGRVYYLDIPANEIFIEEHKKYQWDERTLQPGREPEVIKVDDHCPDAFQYFVKDNLRDLQLKV